MNPPRSMRDAVFEAARGLGGVAPTLLSVLLLLAVPRETRKLLGEDNTACAPGVTVVCDEVPDDAGDGDPRAAGLQTGNPGFPGFSSGGLLFIAGLQAIWSY